MQEPIHPKHLLKNMVHTFRYENNENFRKQFLFKFTNRYLIACTFKHRNIYMKQFVKKK